MLILNILPFCFITSIWQKPGFAAKTTRQNSNNISKSKESQMLSKLVKQISPIVNFPENLKI